MMVMKLLITIIAVLVLYPAVGNSAEKGKPRSMILSDETINYLLAGDVCKAIGLKESRSGRKRFGVKHWKKPSQVFSWPVSSSAGGEHQITVLLKTRKGTPLILKSRNATVDIVIKESTWHRFTTNLELDKGEELIELALGEKSNVDILGLEVITPAHLPTHEKRISEQQAIRKQYSWFQNAGFGLMFQWGYWGYPKKGDRKKPWKRVYREFDIEAFADKMKGLNPGYIIWSVTWRGSRFAAPLKSVEEIMGSKDFTMEYDFLGKLADALHKRQIP